MLLFELLPSKISAQSRSPTTPAIPDTERERAVDWARTNNKWGEQCEAVDDFIFQLHSGIREHTDSTLTWLFGSGTTKSGKAFLLEWGLGAGCDWWWQWWCGSERRFAATELTGQPTDPLAAENAIAFYAGADFTLRELQRVAGANGKVPSYRKWTGMGFNRVNVSKPKSLTLGATVWLRTTAGDGDDLKLQTEWSSSAWEGVPNGKYDIYFVFSDQSDSLYQGDPIVLDGNNVEIQIARIGDGRYGVRVMK